MPRLRTALAGLVAGAAIVSTAPSAAAYEYVTVSTEDGVVSVSTQVPGQPLLSVSVDTRTGRVCVGWSYLPPHCQDLPG